MRSIQKSITNNSFSSNIPDKWALTKLGDCFDELYRYPTYFGIKYVDSGIPEVRGELIQSDGNIEEKTEKFRFITEETAQRFPRVRLEAGDFIMSVRGTMGKIAIVPERLHGAVITANLIRMKFNRSLVMPQWALHFFYSQYFQNELDLATSATTIKTIQVPQIQRLIFLRPPIEEQCRIAEVLDTIDETIQNTEVLIEKLKAMKQGLLHDLLTRGLDENGKLRDPKTHPEQFKDSPLGRIPKNWKPVYLIECISFPEGQIDPKQAPYYNWPLIAPDHIESSTGKLLKVETAKQQGAISGKYIFVKGDVLYSKIRPYLRKAVLANFNGLCSADMYPFHPNDSIISRFLIAVILGEHFSKFASSVSERSGFPKINRNELRDYQFGLPPLNEQRMIAYTIESCDDRINIEEQYLNKLKLQKKGLMHDLLTGKVRVKTES